MNSSIILLIHIVVLFFICNYIIRYSDKSHHNREQRIMNELNSINMWVVKINQRLTRLERLQGYEEDTYEKNSR